MGNSRTRLLYDRWLETAERCRPETALRDLGAGVSLTFGDLLSEVEQLPQDKAGRLRPVVAEGWRFVADVLSAWRDGAILLPLEPSTKAPRLADLAPPESACHAKTTSGSTGAPRLIWFSASQLAADADQIVEAMGLHPAFPNLGAISMAHSYGFSNLVLPLLLHGIPLEIAPNPLPATIARCLAEADGPRTLAAVPSLWRAWLAAGAVDGKSVSTAISAGAPLPLDLEQEAFRKAGLRIHNFYGASECGGIAFEASPDPRTDASCAGRPMPATSIEVAADGRVIVRGENVGLGYADGAGGLGDGLFATSDLGFLDADGLLHLTGRISEAINVAGRKVSPARIEDALSTCPGVVCCLVFGAPSNDPARVEDVVAVVAPGDGFSLEAARTHLADHLQPYECPRQWWINSDLVPDTRGKLPRAQWQAEWAAKGRG